MEPLSAGAIALLTLLLDKTLDKTIEAGVGEAFEHKDKLLKLLKRKSPETGSAIEKVPKNRNWLTSSQRIMVKLF